MVVFPQLLILSPCPKMDPDTSDADDFKDMGVGPVPSVIKIQQLLDGGLVAIRDIHGRPLVFQESWSTEYIDKKFLAPLFLHVWAYMENTHQPLEATEHWWGGLVAERGILKEFVQILY